jgi:hypothetical protein
MPCLRCGQSTTKPARHSFRRTVGGFTFTAEVDVEACASCGDVIVPLPLLLAFDRALACDLARRGPVTGATLRLIRRAASFDPSDLALILGTSVDMIASWEAGRRPVDQAAWLIVAAIALDKLDAPQPLLTRFETLRKSAFEPRVTKLAVIRASEASS